MNSVVMSIRGLPSSELWVPTLLVVPVSSGRNQMVPGGSGGSGGSGDSEIVGFDCSYQSRIRKWYFVIDCTGFYREVLESAIMRAASSSPDRPNRRRAHAARVHFIPHVFPPS